MDRNTTAIQSAIEANSYPLLSVREACRYLGGISRAALYATVLPQVETIHIGGRRMILRAGLDKFIADAGGVK